MDFVFSDNASGVKPSAIREILKLSSQPGIIPFSAGNPAGEAFPVKEVTAITEELLSSDPIGALQYSVTEGYLPLREHISAYMKKTHNVGRDFDKLITTAGAQQVMNLTAKALCNRGDVIVCENPSFVGSLNAFRSMGAKLIGIDMEADGPDISQLEDAFKNNDNVRFFYTIPNFQNPTGITMSLAKRKAVYELAIKYNIPILEDNPYGDTRFSGEALPTIKSMDEAGMVIYAGTFSKVLSPGLRVGFVIAPEQFVDKLVALKQTQDVHTNILGQQIAYKFMTEYDYDGHLKKLGEIYGRKSALCKGEFDKYFKGKIERTDPDGGLFVWCTLPQGVDMLSFVKTALDKKVAVVPGTAFLTDESAPTQSFRINYSTPSDEMIINGMALLAEAAQEFLK